MRRDIVPLKHSTVIGRSAALTISQCSAAVVVVNVVVVVVVLFMITCIYTGGGNMACPNRVLE